MDERVVLVGRPGNFEHEALRGAVDQPALHDVGDPQRLHHLLAIARHLDQRQFALDILKEEHPQLAFLDVMPKMNGFDVCNAIKREVGLTDAYVVC